MPDKVNTDGPIFESLVWLNPDKSWRKRESKPGYYAFKMDTLTTKPTRRYLPAEGERCFSNVTDGAKCMPDMPFHLLQFFWKSWFAEISCTILQWQVCHATKKKKKKGKADLTTVLHIGELPHLHMKLAVWFSFPTTNNKIPMIPSWSLVSIYNYSFNPHQIFTKNFEILELEICSKICTCGMIFLQVSSSLPTSL